MTIDGQNRESLVITFQAPNNIGLGHINRLSCIALAVQDVDRNVRTPFIIEGSSHLFLESLNLPYLTIPTAKDLYRSTQWQQWLPKERRRIVASISMQVLKALQTDLVVYDSFPNAEVVIAMQKLNLPSVICVRKVKDFAAYASFWPVQTILDQAKLILIPHEQDDFALPSQFESKIVYVGDISRRRKTNTDLLRSDFKIGADRIVIITGGGGGHPGTLEFYNFVLRAFAELQQKKDGVRALLVTGPLFQEWMKLEIVEGVRVSPFEPNIDSFFAMADLVISQAGYNSIGELFTIGVQTICIPGHRRYDDQHDRAARLERVASNIHVFNGSTSLELAHLMETHLVRESERADTIEVDGAKNAAVHLLNLLR